jgi:hypothetical protein
MLYSAMLYSAVLYSAMLYSAMLYSAVLYCTVNIHTPHTPHKHTHLEHTEYNDTHTPHITYTHTLHTSPKHTHTLSHTRTQFTHARIYDVGRINDGFLCILARATERKRFLYSATVIHIYTLVQNVRFSLLDSCLIITEMGLKPCFLCRFFKRV